MSSNNGTLVHRQTVAPPANQPASQISQATEVERSRAVAEVQAAVLVAQQVPRDIGRAIADMKDSCGRMALANRAFYSVPNRGNGPSVHLARELARIWGNVQYGVNELRRDDDAGISEVQAFAWDVQTNVRSVRTFIAPHVRMVRGERKALTDIGDIYLSNQNVGARAVRECLFTVLPTWFTEEAQDICRRTLEDGEGVPLPERINAMVAAFGNQGITVKQLEHKIGRSRGSWTPFDLAQMSIVYTSITRGELDKDEEFPQQVVTAADLTGPVATPAPAAQPQPQQAQEQAPAEQPAPEPAKQDKPQAKARTTSKKGDPADRSDEHAELFGTEGN